MENKRLFLIISLLFVSYLLAQAWSSDYGPKPEPVADKQSGVNPATAATDRSIPLNETAAGTDVPEALEASVADLPRSISQQSHKIIRVKTDVFNLVIDTKGGTIRQVDLPTYPISIDQQDKPFRLMSDTPSNYFVAQNGLVSEKNLALKAPTHNVIFSAEQTDYVLLDGEDEIKVDLHWQTAGLSVTKTYTFRRGSFIVELQNTLNNTSGQDWQGFQYVQLQRNQIEENGSAFIYTYMGGVIYTDKERFEKITFDDMFEKNVDRGNTGGWLAMMQHYFLAAWVPDKTHHNQFYSRTLKDDNPKYILGLKSETLTIPDQTQKAFVSQLYVGPKLQHDLEALSAGLELSVDYGVLTFLAQPVYWLLEFFHDIFGNWGWAIIFVTISIKAIFYKLSEASYVSMANMRKLQPKLVSLKERYGEDRAKMNQAMMELYKKEKINPLGGCLPILVQIPVFIALYWVLLESVELRQAPFMLWINDLSIADPYYVLPLLMGASMFIQQKLNPAPLDPIQAKVMMMLPVIFTAFFALFPAGLVLYWVANNVLSIIQQWIITKRIAGKV